MQKLAPVSAVRDGTPKTGASEAAYRQQAAALGWFSMLVPEEMGGGSLSGNGVVDASLVAFERGRELQPGSFVETNVVAYALAVAGGTAQHEAVLKALLAGDQSATWVVGAPAVYEGAGYGIRATETAAGYQLVGTTPLVHEAELARWLLVSAAASGGVMQFLVSSDSDGVAMVGGDSLDLSRNFGSAHLDVLVDSAAVVGLAGGDDELFSRQLAIASVLTAAESVGAMDRSFEMTLQYAKDRIAFGRPIGSFQAIKHALADASLLVETSKAITIAAAETLGTIGELGAQEACMAKAYVGDCGHEVSQACLQIYGGIGQTWEHNQHLYLRRMATDFALYGDPTWQRERLCELSGL